MELNFRLLRADEIDCRVAMAKANGVSLLLYKDARCDMNILDETVTPMNWMRSHSRENANCTVSIWDEDKCQWISKEDTGTESNTEKEKGLASDSFKRACFNWGIGRELYTAPFIWISADKCATKANNSGRYQCYDRFYVKEIGYDSNRRINRLQIWNDTRNNEAFSMVAQTLSQEAAYEDLSTQLISPTKVNALMSMCKRDRVDSNALCVWARVANFSELTERMHAHIISNWDKLKEKFAE